MVLVSFADAYVCCNRTDEIYRKLFHTLSWKERFSRGILEVVFFVLEFELTNNKNLMNKILFCFSLSDVVFFVKVYLSLCCALVAAATGAYLHLLWNIGGFLTTVACLGCMIWLLSTPPYEVVHQRSLLNVVFLFLVRVI